MSGPIQSSVVGCFMVHNPNYQQNFSYIVAVSFIDGGNRGTRGKPPICRKSLTNFII